MVRSILATLAAIVLAVIACLCLGCRSAYPTRPSAAEQAPSADGQNVGGLYFDPQGADFTPWVNQFKNEVYRNWIVPQPALMGVKGHVAFEFMVARDGNMTRLRALSSSGTPTLDRAAQNALSGSQFLPLPGDYRPPRITMRVTFFYDEKPRRAP